MNRLLTILFVTLAFTTSAIAHAQTPQPPRKKIAYTPRFAKDFAFLEIGKTTPESAKAVLGDTKWAYRSYIIENELVIDLGLADLRALYERAGDRDVHEVWVQVFTAGPTGNGVATLVYEDGLLLWAHYPVAASEDSRAKIAASWGVSPMVYKMRPLGIVTKVLYSDHLLVIPGQNVLYFEERFSNYMYKVVYAPQVDFTWGWEKGDLGEPRPR